MSYDPNQDFLLILLVTANINSTLKKNLTMQKPIVLVVLDGWGLGKNETGNAIAQAKLPTIDELNNFYPHVALQASGISVGLPWEETGNSEVGHITLGAGRIIYQSMPRINMEIQSGEFFKNPAFLSAIGHAKKSGSSLHLMGLVSKGAAHSSMEHLYALLELAKKENFPKVFVHAFLDGRDSSPTSGVEAIQNLQKKMRDFGVGKIASLCGRSIAMDRNNNWNQIEQAYNLLTEGAGASITDPIDYLKKSYAKKIYDEYIEPAFVDQDSRIKEKDSVIFFNFREDRARQLTKAFVKKDFSQFKRKIIPDLDFVTMTDYEKGLPVKVAFPPIIVTDPLGKVLSENNLKQLRIAETEKFAHVTYFFNGGSEKPFPQEDRSIVDSQKIDNYANAPEMKAAEITKKVLDNLNKYDFILVNYANADMVGHTGDEKSAIKAVETIDACLARLIESVTKNNGALLVTADHGNVEEMKNNLNGKENTEHSKNPVPLWFITNENKKKRKEDFEVSGLLSDVAPTILDILKLKKPAEMTGESLLSLLK